MIKSMICDVSTERAFAEEKPERVRQFVIADLQNALIDREDRNPGWPVGLIADVQRLAWLRDRSRLQIDLQSPLLNVRGERDDSIAQRTGKNLLRVECAN
jgi:hypothetical protein